ncbi:MAG: hypothetical protein JSS66_10250 [Armatimonadetes bacterium]|nr:hypothetical protein [Armatimonadota bacterium]
MKLPRLAADIHHQAVLLLLDLTSGADPEQCRVRIETILQYCDAANGELAEGGELPKAEFSDLTSACRSCLLGGIRDGFTKQLLA